MHERQSAVTFAPSIAPALARQVSNAVQPVLGVVPCAAAVVNRDLRVVYTNDEFTRIAAPHRDGWLGERIGKSFGCAGRAEDCDRCGVYKGCCDIAHRTISETRAMRGRAPVHSARDHPLEPQTVGVSSGVIHVGDDSYALMIFNDTSAVASARTRDRQDGFHGMIGKHPAMTELYNVIRRVARLKVPVLVQGESGTGKEMVALALHEESARAGRLVTVNSGALPEGVLESELFGHVRGAFTGAVRDARGRFEIANGGTLFLDEIGEITPIMQVKLLRALQEGTFERVGGEQTMKVDVRVICATNRNLENDVASGRFRADLFYRISVVPITVPPLRTRASDIPVLARYLAERAAAEAECEVPALSDDVLNALLRYPWPGNVRELDSAIRFALLNADDGVVQPIHLPERVRGEASQAKYGRLDAHRVNAALRATRGNKRRAAELLGISRATLYRYLGEADDTLVG